MKAQMTFGVLRVALQAHPYTDDIDVWDDDATDYAEDTGSSGHLFTIPPMLARVIRELDDEEAERAIGELVEIYERGCAA